MKIKELIDLLTKQNPEANVMVDVDSGLIYPLSSIQEHIEYNHDKEVLLTDYFLIAEEHYGEDYSNDR